MDAQQIQQILLSHTEWCRGKGGSRAYLHNTDLYCANLRCADLRGADLRDANLRCADLYYANLRDANLYGADLRDTDLYYANLYGADLRDADLYGADLRGADVSKGCLDPDNEPNGECQMFVTQGQFVIGYRTRAAGHIDRYRDGRYYSSDWFSTADTECHPGLYLWPTLELAENWAPNHDLIKVRTRPSEVHRAGEKWRCRWFEVLGRATQED